MGRRFAAQMGAPLTAQSIEIAAHRSKAHPQSRLWPMPLPRRCAERQPDLSRRDAGTYLVDMAFGWTNPGTDYDAKVLGQVDRSIALVREDPLPYSVKSLYLTVVHRLDEGIRAARAGGTISCV